MALQGHIEHLALADLLQTGLHGQASGTLTLRRGAERAVLYLGEGALRVLEPEGVEAEEVLEALVSRGVLAADLLAQARRRDRRGLALLDHLLEEGLLAAVDVMEVLANVAEDVITDLVGWQQGEFRFEEGPLDPRRVRLLGRASVDTAGVLLRAARRMDDGVRIRERLGWYPTLYVRTHAAPPAPREADDPTPAVCAQLDGTLSVTQVALALGLSRIDVLRSILALVEGGQARPATAEELSAGAANALSARRELLARSLLLQWSEQAPRDPEPFRRLAALAREFRQPDHEVDALRALAQVLCAQQAHGEAVAVLLDALASAPHDEFLKEDLRQAAQLAGDDQSFAYGTRLLAEAALQREDPERALELLEPLALSAPRDLELRVLKARALVRLARRDDLAREAELVAGLLDGGGRRRRDREIATWYRDAIAHLCPERSDLLRRFRALTDGQTRRPRRAALLLALLALLAGAGLAWWPKSSRALLAEARAAIEDGRPEDAQHLLAALIEGHADAPEIEEAYQLQAVLAGTATAAGAARAAPDPALRERVEELTQRAGAALAAGPPAEALAALGPLAALLESSAGAALRATTLARLAPAFEPWLARTLREQREAVDVLAQLPDAPRTTGSDPAPLRELLARAERLSAPAAFEATRAVLEALRRFARLKPGKEAFKGLREVESLQGSLGRLMRGAGDALTAARVHLKRLELAEAEAACRQEGPRLLVAGQLAEADALYARLGELLVWLEERPEYAGLLEEARRRQLPDLVKERRGVVQAVQAGLESARAAEAAGDLAAAARAYGALVQRFWSIRLENVFTVPLEVRVTPPGAAVRFNGQPAGAAPLLLRYPWNTQSTLTVTAEGYEPLTHLVVPREQEPVWRVDLRLRPKARWVLPQAGTLHAEPIREGAEVLAVERNGRVSLYSATDGALRWSRHFRSLEGVRTRPAMDARRVYLALLDGTLLVLDRRSGEPRAQWQGQRPVEALALWDGRAAVGTLDGALQLFDEGAGPVPLALGEKVSAGALAAHGRFWVGTTGGRLIGVHPRTHERVEVRVSARSFPVVGLCADADGLIAVAGDGTLQRLGPAGEVRWAKEAIGDIAGDPARCGDRVAVCDRRGRLLCFGVRDGSPAGAFELGAAPVGGLRSAHGLLVAALADGRLWIQHPEEPAPRCDAPLEAPALGAPGLSVDRGLLVAGADGRLALLELPDLPVRD